MGVESFIPMIWSTDILKQFEANLVFNGLVNRDYEGLIRQQGDTVKINSIGPVSLTTYTKNSTTLNYELLQDASQVLQITESKYFAFKLDDVDKAQSNADLRSAATYEAGLALAEDVDKFIAAKYADAATANKLGSDGSAKTLGYTSGNDDPYKTFVNMGVLMDEANVPSAGRWAVIPPWLHGMLRKSASFIANPAGVTGGSMVTGSVGTVAGIEVYTSNHLTKNGGGTVWRCMFGVRSAISLAVQKEATVEAFRLEGSFSDAVRGLTLYGGKVIRPDALAVLFASKGGDA
jgi:hypothetical protein